MIGNNNIYIYILASIFTISSEFRVKNVSVHVCSYTSAVQYKSCSFVSIRIWPIIFKIIFQRICSLVQFSCLCELVPFAKVLAINIDCQLPARFVHCLASNSSVWHNEAQANAIRKKPPLPCSLHFDSRTLTYRLRCYCGRMHYITNK